MAGDIIIIKSDGTPTSPPMAQAQAEKYLGNLLEANRIANLKQSLNDVTGNKGKATGNYTYNTHAVLHASSGIMGVKSVSLFFYENADMYYIIAMGEHTGASSYKLTDYGQPAGNFKKNATINL